MRSSGKNFLLINLAIYRLHVVVTWGTSAAQIVQYAKKHGYTPAKRFVAEFQEHTQDSIGLCMTFSNSNPDVLVWLRERPKRASDYGTLYHELYHAVDSVSESRNLAEELEARAYAYEYLVTEANRFFWSCK